MMDNLSSESDLSKAVKALSIPEEHHAKLLVIVSASDGSKPLSPDNSIKMAVFESRVRFLSL